jgi:hypothetical protein
VTKFPAVHLLVTGARRFAEQGLLTFLNSRGIGILAAGFRHPQMTREGIAEMVAWARSS